MKGSNNNPLSRIKTIRYVPEDSGEDRQILTFGSLDRGNNEEEKEDGDVGYQNSLFTYNKGEDIYKLNTMKQSHISKANSNFDIIDEKNESDNNQKEIYSDKEKEVEDNEDIRGGNIIFANLINIDFKQKKLTPLYIIVFCYLIFSFIEVIYGYKINSLTLMADAAHYFSESSCFVIYIVSIYVSRTKATNNMSFGFHRGEMIGVLVRATFLFGLSFWLLYYVAY